MKLDNHIIGIQKSNDCELYIDSLFTNHLLFFLFFVPLISFSHNFLFLSLLLYSFFCFSFSTFTYSFCSFSLFVVVAGSAVRPSPLAGFVPSTGPLPLGSAREKEKERVRTLQNVRNKDIGDKSKNNYDNNDNDNNVSNNNKNDKKYNNNGYFYFFNFCLCMLNIIIDIVINDIIMFDQTIKSSFHSLWTLSQTTPVTTSKVIIAVIRRKISTGKETRIGIEIEIVCTTVEERYASTTIH